MTGVSELLAICVTWWLISLSGVMMPGPVSAMAVTEGARLGVVAGPLITAGHAAAELLMLGALAVGMNQVLRHPEVIALIGLLGGAVLLGMGYGIARAAWEDRLQPPEFADAGGLPGASLVRAGVLTTLTNPYWLLWWATVGAGYYALFSRYGAAALLVLFFAGHIALDLGWNSLLAFAVGAGRRRVPRRVYRGILGACGVFVMAMSLYFAYSGLRFLRH